MIWEVNLLSKTPDFGQTNFKYDQRGHSTIGNSRLQRNYFPVSVEEEIYYWKLQTPDKLIFNMIRGANLLLETPNSKEINLQHDQREQFSTGNSRLQTN